VRERASGQLARAIDRAGGAPCVLIAWSITGNDTWLCYSPAERLRLLAKWVISQPYS
jgi:hypothetical protein